LSADGDKEIPTEFGKVIVEHGRDLVRVETELLRRIKGQ
jgi:hypothetical protein